MRAPQLEEALKGLSIANPTPRPAIEAFTGPLTPPNDHSASAEYRRALIAELLDQAIKTACTRALENV